MFPLYFLGVDLIRVAAPVKLQHLYCSLHPDKKGAQPERGAPFSLSRHNVGRRGVCREQDVVSSGSDPEILLTRQVFKSPSALVADTGLGPRQNMFEVHMATDSEARKAMAQRAIDRAAARGVPIDQDPAFLALLDEWGQGQIEFKELRASDTWTFWRSRPPSGEAVGGAG
ncbi:hypothetical protein JNB91_16325 [Rhizobium wenxiniae]|uniref:hypothetical protein n=1 Tax=Rhizobium wenxiniae TaxID=1737357 RepID=UPI001C6EB7DD|nr:hypothetical protein [Rhizobium wenxiniae]MBW9089403.1 hypothetical protein [Rhizobium wenxiniae]